ncbi:hypothetical protein FHG87_011060 [Trinorchestia longiramus]|nr:hypothetical protein FHG87_011060 [Trinorchestia longiramus]
MDSLPRTSKVNISAKNSHHLKNSTHSQQQSKESKNHPSCLQTRRGSNNPRTNKKCTYSNSPRTPTLNVSALCRRDFSTPVLDVKTKTVIFLHDNATSHAAKVTQEKFLQLRWSVLPHPPYSPDLAPTDFHPFRSLQNALQNKNLLKSIERKMTSRAFLNQNILFLFGWH